jgi:alcohol dehydrogenase (NADP+)
LSERAHLNARLSRSRYFRTNLTSGPVSEGLSSINVHAIAGSLIGGIAETQEMLDFCAKKSNLPDCAELCMDWTNEACERMERADVRYRFVSDMASL